MIIHGINTEEFSDEGIAKSKEEFAKFLEEVTSIKRESPIFTPNQTGIDRANSLAANFYGG